MVLNESSQFLKKTITKSDLAKSLRMRLLLNGNKAALTEGVTETLQTLTEMVGADVIANGSSQDLEGAFDRITRIVGEYRE